MIQITAGTRKCASRTLMSVTSLARTIALPGASHFVHRGTQQRSSASTMMMAMRSENATNSMRRMFSMTSLSRTEQEDGENKAEQEQQHQQEQQMEETEVEVEQDAGQIMEESAEETVDTVQVSEEVPTEEDFEASRLHEVNEELEKREEQEVVEAGDTKKRSSLTAEERDDVNNRLVYIIGGTPGMFTRRDMQRYLASLGVYSSETQKQKQLFPIDRILPVFDRFGTFRERFVVRFENQEQVETVVSKQKSGIEKSKDKVAVRSFYMPIHKVLSYILLQSVFFFLFHLRKKK